MKNQSNLNLMKSLISNIQIKISNWETCGRIRCDWLNHNRVTEKLALFINIAIKTKHRLNVKIFQLTGNVSKELEIIGFIIKN